MHAAEKKLHKIAQRDKMLLKRAQKLGLQVNFSALDDYIQRDFLNQGFDQLDCIPEDKEPTSSQA